MNTLNQDQQKITVLTGAGISKASGIPTFRGADGLWKTYNAAELATPNAFTTNPKLVWEWYRWRINLIMEAQPNPAHKSLARLEEKGYNITIITQNVDDLHDRVSDNVLHVHGEILRAKCIKCGEKIIWTSESLHSADEIPKCYSCGHYLRPDVVWFGERLNAHIMTQCMHRLVISDLLLVVGTSGVVYPVAEFPFLAKRENPRIQIYEFNISKTPISRITTETILGPVEKTLVDFLAKSNL